MPGLPVFRSAFHSPEDEFSGRGVRPVVFDILGPDHETSILPDYLKMVLHVNPTSMKMSHQKIIERIHTEGGFVEQHFGDGTETIQFELATGGFMRLYTGLSNITGGGIDVGGTRRETIAYDKYLDLLALFHNNGHVYDYHGRLVFDGIIKIWFDGHTWYGWFQNFSVTEEAETPYQFRLSANFIVDHERVTLRTTILPASSSFSEDPTSTNFRFEQESEFDSLVNPLPYESFPDPGTGLETENMSETSSTGAAEFSQEPGRTSAGIELANHILRGQLAPGEVKDFINNWSRLSKEEKEAINSNSADETGT